MNRQTRQKARELELAAEAAMHDALATKGPASKESKEATADYHAAVRDRARTELAALEHRNRRELEPGIKCREQWLEDGKFTRRTTYSDGSTVTVRPDGQEERTPPTSPATEPSSKHAAVRKSRR